MRQIEKNALWVFCETQAGRLLPVGLQILCRARELAGRRQCKLYALVLGELAAEEQEPLMAAGADGIVHVVGSGLEQKLEQPYADCLIRLAKEHEPEILLVGATPFGRAFLPRVAAALGTGLTADCTELDIDSESGLLLQTRPAFGGNLMATIRTAVRRPQMATVRPGVLPLQLKEEHGQPDVIALEDNTLATAVKLLRETALPPVDDISQSRIIVSAGRGIGEKKNMKLVRRLAELLGGSVGASRPLVDMGFCPYSCQIGQTGHSVAPDLLICCGISGAVQHLAGIGGAKTIVAINSDPKAPIFTVADYQIVGDCTEVLKALIGELEK